jgi:hypothetical protein
MSNDFEALKVALLGEELNKLQALHAKYEDDESFLSRSAKQLPQAILQNSANSGSIVNALKVPVVSSLSLAAKSHKEELTKALAPVILPIIGQTVSNAVGELKNHIEVMTSSMFTAQGLRWRMEARKTGKTYTEIAFKSKYKFVLHHLVLNSKNTGVVLAHSSAEGFEKSVAEPSKISLAQAARDACKKIAFTSGISGIEKLTIDEYQLYTAHGVFCSLSCVTSGEVPDEFLVQFLQCTNNIEMDHNKALLNPLHNAGDFTGVDAQLTQLLAYVPVKEEAVVAKKSSILPKLILWLLCLLLLAYIAWVYYNKHEKEKITDALHGNEGFVTLAVEGDTYNGWQVRGMHDPSIFYANKLNLEPKVLNKTVFNTTPFVSLSPKSMLARLNKKIPPNPTVALSFKPEVPGTLFAKGTAEPAWIEQFKTKASNIEGIQAVDTSELIANTNPMVQIEALKKQLEEIYFLYQPKSADFANAQAPQIEAAVALINQINTACAKNNIKVSYLVNTHIAGSTSRETNKTLLDDRFTALLLALSEKQLDTNLFKYQNPPDVSINQASANIKAVINK